MSKVLHKKQAKWHFNLLAIIYKFYLKHSNLEKL